jgi:hypothetical protein
MSLDDFSHWRNDGSGCGLGLCFDDSGGLLFSRVWSKRKGIRRNAAVQDLAAGFVQHSSALILTVDMQPGSDLIAMPGPGSP